MKLRCPVCFVRSEDAREPLDARWQEPCFFCRTTRTREELLRWQFQQLKSISDDDLREVLRFFFFYMMDELDGK